MTSFRSYAKLPSTALLACLLTACGALDAIVPAAETTTSIRIDSDPPGADLFVMGKHAGTTPTIINDRDIYPVTYSMGNEKFYGKVLVRKDGCEEYSKRLTRADISDGLTAILMCAATPVAAGSTQQQQAQQSVSEARSASVRTPAAPPELTESSPVSATTLPVTSTEREQKLTVNSEASAERRLQQLRSLQQLLDDGLITEEEEENLRRRILEAL